MSDDDFFMNDEVPKKNEDSDSSDLEDDWDVDEDEVAAKKAAKEAAKQAEIDKENERIRKLEARKKAEKEAEEERIRKLNEKKTQEQLEEELEAQRYAEANEFLGGDMKNLKISASNTPVDDDPDNPMNVGGPVGDKTTVIEVSQPVVKREKDLHNFTPNCKPACDDFSKMLTKRIFEMQKDKNFNYLVETCVKGIANDMPVEQWEVVKKLGQSLSAIGNAKQTEFKKKNTKKTKGKGKDKPSLGGANKAGASDPFGGDAVYEDFDEFM